MIYTKYTFENVHNIVLFLVCSANQWTDFYMIRTFVIKELKDTNNLLTEFPQSRIHTPNPQAFSRFFLKFFDLKVY